MSLWMRPNVSHAIPGVQFTVLVTANVIYDYPCVRDSNSIREILLIKC